MADFVDQAHREERSRIYGRGWIAGRAAHFVHAICQLPACRQVREHYIPGIAEENVLDLITAARLVRNMELHHGCFPLALTILNRSPTEGNIQWDAPPPLATKSQQIIINAEVPLEGNVALSCRADGSSTIRWKGSRSRLLLHERAGIRECFLLAPLCQPLACALSESKMRPYGCNEALLTTL